MTIAIVLRVALAEGTRLGGTALEIGADIAVAVVLLAALVYAAVERQKALWRR